MARSYNSLEEVLFGQDDAETACNGESSEKGVYVPLLATDTEGIGKWIRKHDFTSTDRKLMAEILFLRKKKKKVYTYISPNMRTLANDGDVQRTEIDHDLMQHAHEIRVHQEFLTENNKEVNQFRKEEKKKENKPVYDAENKQWIAEGIDVSNFDDQDYAVLNFINRVIASLDERRDNAPKKSTNNILKMSENETSPLNNYSIKPPVRNNNGQPQRARRIS
jgi:hypothetical protein